MEERKLGKIALLSEPRGEFVIQEYPLPEPVPGTLLLRQELAGICGTDAHIWAGYGDPALFPIVLGHENVGIIEALGEGVGTDFFGNPVQVGDRVAVKPGVSCNACYFCLVLGSPTRCPNKRGAYGFNPPGTSPFNGGFAQYLSLDIPGTFFFKTEMEPERAVLLEPFTVALHGADRSKIRLGDAVVVQGSGAIGLLTIVCAKMAGAAKMIAIGGPKGRLELARELGADMTIDIAEVTEPEERVKLVRENTPRGYGADVVFECAGVPAALIEGISLVRDSGTLVEMGNFIDTGSVSLNPNRHLVTRNLNLIAVFGSSVEHFTRALAILERGEYPFAKMISHKIPLGRIREGMEALQGAYRMDERGVSKIAVAPNQP